MSLASVGSTAPTLPLSPREDVATELATTWLRMLERARELGAVAPACRELGVSRPTFYRIWRLHRRGGEAAVIEAARRAASRSAPVRRQVERAVLQLTEHRPGWGRQRIAGALRALGYECSPHRVWNVWQRHGLLRG